MAHFDNTGGEIILMGDMNGRVGNALDFVADDVDIDDNLLLPDDYEPDCEIKARNSNDKDVISGHGKDLLRFCKSTKFRIMNGRGGGRRETVKENSLALMLKVAALSIIV